MSDATIRLAALRRPRLLIRAARHGLDHYSRRRDLRRVLRADPLPSPAAAARALFEIEAMLEDRRIDGDAAYSPARHVDALIALLAEVRAASASDTLANAPDPATTMTAPTPTRDTAMRIVPLPNRVPAP